MLDSSEQILGAPMLRQFGYPLARFVDRGGSSVAVFWSHGSLDRRWLAAASLCYFGEGCGQVRDCSFQSVAPKPGWPMSALSADFTPVEELVFGVLAWIASRLGCVGWNFVMLA